MFKQSAFLLVLLSLSSVWGSPSLQEKQFRLQYFKAMSHGQSILNFEAHARSFEYVRKNLSIEEQVSIEANLFSESIRLRVQEAYESALTTKSPEEAKLEVQVAIDRDLELASDDFKPELRKLAIDALNQVEAGSSGTALNLASIKNLIAPGVEERASYFNSDFSTSASSDANSLAESDLNKKIYGSKDEILESLTSSRPGSEFETSSNINYQSTQIQESKSEISFRLRIHFLGASIEGGPQISFNRIFISSASFGADGMHPIFNSRGEFDFTSRDNFGRPMMRNGSPKNRLIHFTCNAAVEFETNYDGMGGFHMAGVGGKQVFRKKYRNNSTINSRRILVPEVVGNKTVDLKYLNNLCLKDFMNATISPNLTVKGSLDIMMKNIVDSLEFSHPKTTCVQDTSCSNWFHLENISLLKIRNIGRCIENKDEKYKSCQLRGLEGQKCPVFNKEGKRLSDGLFEFECDQGLKCQQTKANGWFKSRSIYSYATGVCVPVYPGSYTSP